MNMNQKQRDIYNKKRREKYAQTKTSNAQSKTKSTAYSKKLTDRIKSLLVNGVVRNKDIYAQLQLEMPEEIKDCKKLLLMASISYHRRKVDTRNKQGKIPAQSLEESLEKVLEEIQKMQDLYLEMEDYDGAKQTMLLKKQITSTYYT